MNALNTNSFLFITDLDNTLVGDDAALAKLERLANYIFRRLLSRENIYLVSTRKLK